MSAFDDLSDIRPHQLFDGMIARAVGGERVMFAVVELEPGSVVPAHRHENEQLGLLLRGTLTLQVADEERTVGPGETWCIGSNIEHSGHAGSEGAVVIDVFSPPRSDWEDLDRLEARPPRWP